MRTAYLRFNVSVPPGEVVTKATLKLFMTSGSSASVFANQVASTSWGETTTTYANAPAIGAQVAASGAFSANAYVSMDVTPAVTGSGLVSFAVTRTDTVPIGFNSREAAAANRPELVVTTTPAGDTTAPLVSVSAPTPGSVVAGSAVTVSASASDNVGVAGVQFKLDGANLGAEDTSAPYSIVWDTTGVANGPHTLTAVARDAANNTATAADVGVTVSNVTVALSAPAAGSMVSGTGVTVSATAAANVTGVQFKLDGANLGAEDTSAPYSIVWDTTGVANGPHTLTAVARDAANNTATAADVGVTVSNLTVALSAPAAGSTVSGTAVTVSAEAAGNVTGVQFKLDGVDLGAEDTSAPYSIVWDTTGVANGPHTLSAVARDAANNTATAADVGVTVSNLTVAMSAPAAGSTVSGASVTVSADASNDIVGVQFKLDGVNLGAEDTSAPYSIVWDTTGVANSPHTLSAVARDAANNTATAADVGVTVSNLTVAVSAPAAGSTVSGASVSVSADAGGPVAGVQFKLDGANLGVEDTSAPYSIVWDTTGVANGPHTLTAVARDAANNTATAADVGVTVSNLTVALSAPAAGSMLSGTGVTVSATAAANVTGVQFKLDGVNLGAEDTSAPYSIVWDTTGVANGPHTLSAVARDAANNTGMAPGISITVANLSTSTLVPVADTEVRADIPTTNFGTATVMALDGSPVRRAYLRFNVSVPPGEVVTKATLRLFMTSSSSASVFANQVASTSWGETTTTYSNAPAIGAQVIASGAFSANAYVSMDVTPAITGSGLVSFAVTRTDTVPVGFNSREAAAANRPLLIVETHIPDQNSALDFPERSGDRVSGRRICGDGLGQRLRQRWGGRSSIQAGWRQSWSGGHERSLWHQLGHDGCGERPAYADGGGARCGQQHRDCHGRRGDGVECDGGAERAGCRVNGVGSIGQCVGRCRRPGCGGPVQAGWR